MTRNAADILTDPPPEPADARLPYGPAALQFRVLRHCEGDGLAVVVHGGAWKAAYDLVHVEHLCVAFRDAGIATFNVEYRRVGDAGGGWPGSLEDVLRAVEYADGLRRASCSSDIPPAATSRYSLRNSCACRSSLLPQCPSL